MIKVSFLGRLQHIAKATERIVTPEQGLTISGLIANVAADNLELREALQQPSVRAVINSRLVAMGSDPLLEIGDTVAFMLPVTGG